MRSNLRSNAVWAIVEVVMSGLVLFFMYRIVVGYLGVKSLGIWSLVLATTSLGRLADIGTAAGLGRFVATAEAKNDTRMSVLYVETAILTTLALYLVIALLMWAPAHYGLSLAMSPDALAQGQKLLPFSLVSFVLMSITSATTGAIVGQHRSDQRSMISLAGLVVQFSIAVLFIPHYGLPALAWAQIAQYSLIIIASWFLFLRNHSNTWVFSVPIHWRKDVFQELLGFGMKLQAVSIISTLYEPVVKFFMSSLGGLEALGFYEMALRIVMQVRQLVVMPIQPLMPRFAHLMECEPEKIEPLYHKAMALTVVFGLPLLAGVALASPVICTIWIGRIEPLFVIFIIMLSVGWFANLVAAPAYLLGMALGRLKWNLYGAILTTVGAALLSFILGYFFGKFGVAVPAIAMLGIGSLLTMVMNCRMLHIRLFPAAQDFHTVFDEAWSYLKRRKYS